MGYLAVWKILEEMLIDFRKRGIAVPVEVMNDLKNAKTTMNILKADSSRGENVQKIIEYLERVESHLVSEGQERFGEAYATKWLERLDDANAQIENGEEKETTFIPGLPKQQKWIRIASSAEIPLEKLKTAAQEMHLSYDVQEGGCLLVHGEDKSIKEFVKKLASMRETETGKYRKKVHNR